MSFEWMLREIMPTSLLRVFLMKSIDLADFGDWQEEKTDFHWQLYMSSQIWLATLLCIASSGYLIQTRMVF